MTVGCSRLYLSFTIRANRDPCEKMLDYLQKYFHPTKVTDSEFSLSIRSGSGGARLSHDHAKQYQYVLQSLSLWREVLHDMFKLWCFAEEDLLDENNWYRLRDTGQGLNRVQGKSLTVRLGLLLSFIHFSLHSRVSNMTYYSFIYSCAKGF